MPSQYTNQNIPMCRDCGLNTTDWMWDNGLQIHWTVQLKKLPSSEWICQRCETGKYYHRSRPKRGVQNMRLVRNVEPAQRNIF
jgi:hypothetical protein